MNASLPPGMRLIVSYDTSVFIEQSIGSVFETIVEAIVLVVLVIFFFLRNLRATLIPIVTIPVSLIGAFGLMYAFGFTINTLTLLAMVLAIGLVVDDAIVMLENIFRHVEEGMPRKEAAIKGAREIGFAIIAMTLTLDLGVRAAGVRHRAHRPAVHRVRADAGRRGAGVGLRRADAVADDVLAAPAAREKALLVVQHHRRLDRRPHSRLPSRADGGAARALADRRRLVRRGRAGRDVLPAAQVGTRAARRPRRDSRASCRGRKARRRSTPPTRSSRSKASTRRFPRRRRISRSRDSRRSSTASRCCA